MPLPILSLVLALMVQQPAPQMSLGQVKQKATCAVAGVQGNVVVNCSAGVPRSIVALLNQQFAGRLKDKEIRIADLTIQVNEYKDRLDKLIERLGTPGMDEGLRLKAEELLKAGKLDQAGAVMDKIIDSGENEVDQIATDQFDRASLYELKFQPLQAIPHYDKAYTYRPNNPLYSGAYGLLLYKQKEYAKAEPILKQAINSSRDLAKVNPQLYTPYVGATSNNLAHLYSNLNRFTDAIVAYRDALDAYRYLARLNPAYQADLAATQIYLGSAYDENHQLNESAKMLDAAQITFIGLAKVDPQKYLSGLASAQKNLGNLYSDMNRPSDALDASKKAIATYRNLDTSDPRAYRFALADALNDEGILYYKAGEVQEADQVFTEALTIFHQLAEANPQAYLPGVAGTESNLGNLYSLSGRTTSAIDAYQKASAIYSDLAKANPEPYLSSEAETQIKLGETFSKARRKDQAEEPFTKALEIYSSLVKTNPQAYLPFMAEALENLGIFYLNTQRMKQADDNFTQALEAYRQLAKTDSNTYLPEVARVLNNLGLLYKAVGAGAEREAACKQAFSTFAALSISNPASFAPEIVNVCLP